MDLNCYQPKMRFTCALCGSFFPSRKNVYKHLRQLHSRNLEIQYPENMYKFKCLDGCNISFKVNSDLRNHLAECHDIRNEIEELTFNTLFEFYSWLEENETRNNLKYKKIRGTKRYGKDFENTYYECIHSLQVKSIKSKFCKSDEGMQISSCNLNVACTSQIILKRNFNTDVCYVKYFKTHYNHELSDSKETKPQVAQSVQIPENRGVEIKKEASENNVEFQGVFADFPANYENCCQLKQVIKEQIGEIDKEIDGNNFTFEQLECVNNQLKVAVDFINENKDVNNNKTEVVEEIVIYV